MLELEPGRGITYFGGRPAARPSPIPPARWACSSATCPATPRAPPAAICACSAPRPGSRPPRRRGARGRSASREPADERLATFSLGMDRRLGVAAPCSADPHALVLDDPAQGLSPRETAWLHGLLRATRPGAAPSCSPHATPRRRAGRPTGSSPWTRADSSPTRPPHASPHPAAPLRRRPVARTRRRAWRTAAEPAERRREVVADERQPPRACYGTHCRGGRRDRLPARHPAAPLADETAARHRPGPRQAPHPAERGLRVPPAAARAAPVRAGPRPQPARPCATSCAASRRADPWLIALAAVLVVPSWPPLVPAAHRAPRLHRCACWPAGRTPAAAARRARRRAAGRARLRRGVPLPRAGARRGTVPRRLGLLLAKLVVTAAARCCSRC